MDGREAVGRDLGIRTRQQAPGTRSHECVNQKVSGVVSSIVENYSDAAGVVHCQAGKQVIRQAGWIVVVNLKRRRPGKPHIGRAAQENIAEAIGAGTNATRRSKGIRLEQAAAIMPSNIYIAARWLAAPIHSQTLEVNERPEQALDLSPVANGSNRRYCRERPRRGKARATSHRRLEPDGAACAETGRKIFPGNIDQVSTCRPYRNL